MLLHTIEALYHWNAGELDTALVVSDKGLACAQVTGIHNNDVLLHYSGGIAGLMSGRIEAAEAHSVAGMEKSQPAALMNVVSHHQLAGMVAWHNGQHALSRSHLVQSAERAKSAGLIFVAAFLFCRLAFIECEIGGNSAGRVSLIRTGDLVDGITIPFIDVNFAILEAWLVLKDEDNETRFTALKDAFQIARRNDSGHFLLVASCAVISLMRCHAPSRDAAKLCIRQRELVAVELISLIVVVGNMLANELARFGDF